MQFNRLYELLCENYDDDEDTIIPEVDRRTQIAKNLEKRSPQDVWKVAQDIRKNIGDYPDLEIAEVLDHASKTVKRKYQKELDDEQNNARVGNELYDKYEAQPLFRAWYRSSVLSVIDEKRNLIFLIQKRGGRAWDGYGYMKKHLIHKLSLDEVKTHQKRWKNANLELAACSIARTVENHFNDTDRRIKQEQKKAGEANMQKIENFYKMRTELYKMHEIGNSKKKMEKMTDITPADKNFLMNHFKIGTPEIYRFLIEHSYNIPKHPHEIAEGLHGLPRNMLNEIVEDGKTPLDITKYYSRFTDMGEELNDNGNDVSFEINGFARVLNTDSNQGTNHALNKKEAYEWMKYVASKYQEQKNKFKRRSYNSSNIALVENFPSYYLRKFINEQNTNEERDFSFQSWMTMRWFAHNIKSAYFWKEMTVHGPAAQEETFIPGNYLSKIQDADLVNGLKTSPENAFRNAGEREARDFEEKNKEQEFTYDRQFTDTENVKVVRNTNTLKHEGQRLSHCVGGYGPSCLSKRSLILSLPNSTAELDPINLTVYQHRGTRNASPPEHDKKFLKDWIYLNSDDKI